MPEDRAFGAPAVSGGHHDGGLGGPRRVLVAIYGTFALAAGARAGVQLATKFSEAPVAYLLSAFAAVVYIVATAGLARGGRGGRLTALTAISVELVGVLVVGTLSLTDRAAFPDATVWSVYGKGYGFVPLVLPVLGLLLLRQQADDGGEGPATVDPEGPDGADPLVP
ncbi:MAG: hypothetical protein ACXVX8_09225 [Blastococcus sp.]